jgi:hypothetical protein
MQPTQSLASASSTPLPSSASTPSQFALPERFVFDLTDKVAALREMTGALTALESLLDPAADPPPLEAVAGIHRILCAELTRRLASVEALLPG